MRDLKGISPKLLTRIQQQKSPANFIKFRAKREEQKSLEKNEKKKKAQEETKGQEFDLSITPQGPVKSHS